MRVTIAYTAVAGGKETYTFASRFGITYGLYKPPEPHKLITVCNGGPPNDDWGVGLQKLGSDFYPRSNEGWDIGGYLDLAQIIDTDFLVCFGQSCYFHRAGWLTRLLQAREKFGEGMYGIWPSNNTTQHLITTGFAVDAKLLRSWPAVKTKEDRYNFEHHPSHSFWRRVLGLGLAVKAVMFSGEYGPSEWRLPKDGFWKGTQRDCLAFCNHTDRYSEATQETKRTWERNADTVKRG